MLCLLLGCSSGYSCVAWHTKLPQHGYQHPLSSQLTSHYGDKCTAKVAQGQRASCILHVSAFVVNLVVHSISAMMLDHLVTSTHFQSLSELPILLQAPKFYHYHPHGSKGSEPRHGRTDATAVSSSNSCSMPCCWQQSPIAAAAGFGSWQTSGRPFRPTGRV
jgi:hypothetical protein